MKEEWKADITNDPNDDYNLVIDLKQNKNHIGRLYIHNEELFLRLYSSSKHIDVPAKWLENILKGAEEELMSCRKED